ncbi:MAG: hypothetical protein LBE03_02135 [Candidatus Nomurabacteria bacterium]|jgi:F0F1-type ATP synthase membrane subunit b/b'|nr:hypothetical protein [Candidatus Nomurabacteria bacterium]
MKLLVLFTMVGIMVIVGAVFMPQLKKFFSESPRSTFRNLTKAGKRHVKMQELFSEARRELQEEAQVSSLRQKLQENAGLISGAIDEMMVTAEILGRYLPGSVEKTQRLKEALEEFKSHMKWHSDNEAAQIPPQEE